MKKILLVCCTLAAVLGLTPVAYADSIPIDPPGAYAGGWLAVLSVVAVVVVTAGLLRRFWKKK